MGLSDPPPPDREFWDTILAIQLGKEGHSAIKGKGDGVRDPKETMSVLLIHNDILRAIDLLSITNNNDSNLIHSCITSAKQGYAI